MKFDWKFWRKSKEELEIDRLKNVAYDVEIKLQADLTGKAEAKAKGNSERESLKKSKSKGSGLGGVFDTLAEMGENINGSDVLGLDRPVKKKGKIKDDDFGMNLWSVML